MADFKELLALFLISAVPIVWGLYTLYFGLASRHWPITQGKIIRSKISKTEYVDPTIVRLISGKYHGVLFAYNPDIRFEYNVNGNEYIGDRIKFGFGESTITAEGSKKKVNSLKAGTSVSVHYQPSNSQKSVLIPGITASTALVSIVLIAFGSLIALLFIAEFTKAFKIHL